MINLFLWGGRKPRIHIDKLYQPKREGGLSLPNILFYSISFEMAKLAKYWTGIHSDLDWILIEQELTSPFRPTETLVQMIKQKNKNMMNPILVHSRKVWQEVHKKCKIPYNNQTYASIWYNPKIKIGKQMVYWAQWLRKGIRKLDDLFDGGDFLSY